MATLVASSSVVEAPAARISGREDVVGALEGEGTVDAEGLEPPGVVGRVLEAGQLGVEPHRPMLPLSPGRRPRAGPAARRSSGPVPSPGDGPGATLGRWHHRPAPPTRRPARIRTTDTVGFGLGPANPDAFLTALGDRDDWVDLTFGGALLLGYYTVLAHPNVSYRCGFFGPAERMLLAGGANIELVPGGFRQFAPILRRYDPRVMTVLAAPPVDGDGQPLAPPRRHLRRAAAGRAGPRPAPGGRGQPPPAPDPLARPRLHQHHPPRPGRRAGGGGRRPVHPAPARARRDRRGHRRGGPLLRHRRRHAPDRHRRGAQHGGHQAGRGPRRRLRRSTPRCSPTA